MTITSIKHDLASLSRKLAELRNPRVLILGDLIMDRYVVGDVNRISPEAPIPVLAARADELRLGGAGNVAANLRAMEAEAEVIGVVGDDGLGRAMREALEALGVGADGVIIDGSRPTIEKSRMMSGVHQMLRVDREDPRPIDGVIEEAVLARIDAAVGRAAAVVLSDYGKGLLTDRVLRAAIDAARARGIPTLVDPKGADFRRYRGATLITPNKREAESALGRRIPSLDDVPAAADDLIAQAELDLVVITLSAEGIYFRTRGAQGAPREGRAPAQARAVFDVTGAGDTVVSQLALYLADGFDYPEAVALANHAAGVVVARLGTHAVTRSELEARLSESGAPRGKVLTSKNLDRALEAWRRDGKRLVFTNGCFDVLHAGHVDYLRFASEQGDILLVGLNSDASVRRLKGESRPLNCLADRAVVLSALEMVDAVVEFEEDTPKEIIERVTPDVLVKGEDWASKGVVGREWVETHGGQVVLAPLVPGRSTSSIVERARDGRGVPLEGA
jgi:D-beta-D-heptose 7-phosphate kinase/D-beta-D-heptose 1-phosphate adenosyltransferase